MNRRIIFLIIILIYPIAACSDAQRIIMDGFFDDWQSVQLAHIDESGDARMGSVDFGKLWITNDDRYLFLRIELEKEINLQNDNALAIYLDTDNNAATGFDINGIGAELEWQFGNRQGTFHFENKANDIRQNQVKIVTAPTVTDTQFEIAFDRSAEISAGQPLYQSSTIKVVLKDMAEGGDMLPEAGQIVRYTFDDAPPPQRESISIKRGKSSHLRLLTYNVLRDNFFREDKYDQYQRILSAVKPDIIGFEEIYDHSAAETAALVEKILPTGRPDQWYNAKVDPDIITVSLYPILDTHPIDGNGAFLIDLRPDYDSQLLLIVAHPPSGSSNDRRQKEIDAIMAFIRDVKNNSAPMTVESNTPIIIMGDMNLVGYAQQVKTLLTGDIVNQDRYGAPFTPDWDGGPFQDLMPPHTDLPMTFTWYDEGSSFSPGRLDYIVYSGSVLKSHNEFVLFTPAMPADTLAKYKLQADDVTEASDHLPVVGDFSLKAPNDLQRTDARTQKRTLTVENYPNPFNGSTNILMYLNAAQFVSVNIYNLHGQKLESVTNRYLPAGEHKILYQADNLASGIYYYVIQTVSRTVSGKMILLR